jgi:uncharacterized circularly permuted ATP-grasp superfamily protein/uncharacterized alpha-E superfamily protein
VTVSASSLPSYRPLAGRFDELSDERGRVRSSWEGLVRVFDRLGPDEIEQRRAIADRLLAAEGAGYLVDERDAALPVHLDPVPLLWSPADWAVLGAGLAQRARILEALLHDLYGERRLLRSGVVPAELALSRPGYQYAAAGVRLHRPHLTLYAADIVRDATGRLVVLRDHTDAPSGAGFAIVHRQVLARLFADVYRDLRVERLTGFSSLLRTALAALAPEDRPSPRTVVLTPGTGHPSYFEHTYLASHLGYHLVEGADLAVRAGRVWLRALAGLEPIDVVLRRVTDGAADPLELRPGGAGGVPGLMEAVREGGVGLANPLGSGLAGDVAFQACLAEVCRELLGEALILPSLPTWWLGDPDQRAHALDRLDDLVVHDTAAPTEEAATVFLGRLGEGEQKAWLDAVAAQPSRFVAQPHVELGTMPVLDGRTVGPGTVVVRTLAVGGPGGWTALPGGVGRVVDARSPVLTQRSTTAKDVWVLAGDRSQPLRLWSAVAPDVPQVDLGTSLPSRVAEALFWVGRNAERAEVIGRLSVALLSRSEQSPELAEAAGGVWTDRVLAALRAVSGGQPAGNADRGADDLVRAEVAAALGERPGALGDSLAHLARSAGSVREYLSSGTWRVVGTLDARRLGLASEATKTDLYVVTESLHDVVLSLMALAGLTAESIVRGPGWRFLDLGRRIERAVLLLGMVESVLVPPTPRAAVQDLYETLLAASESLVAYRRRFRSDLELDAVGELLLGDDTNPRSVAFQVDRITEHLATLPARRELHHQRALAERANRLVIAAGWLDQGRPAPDAAHPGIQQFVLDVRGALLELTESVVATWFAHVGEVHAVRRGDLLPDDRR